VHFLLFSFQTPSLSSFINLERQSPRNNLTQWCFSTADSYKLEEKGGFGSSRFKVGVEWVWAKNLQICTHENRAFPFHFPIILETHLILCFFNFWECHCVHF
jgi:hypothetical protein